ncbi:MAG: class I poly(R)-hydroxyalkanoic acid synthase [Alphaproteobacteria bacterium]|nr:class I poly(R)-hydroxyalkanoic acid synthase [Alphaproteobacteria bacterium]
MSEQPQPDLKLPDPKELSQAVASIAERSQRLMADFVSRQAESPSMGMADPLNIGRAFAEMMGQLAANPARLVEAQMNLWNDYMRLWQNTARRMLGEEADPIVAPEPADRRFKDEAWQSNEVFDYIKQSYLLTARWVQSVVGSVEGLDEKTARKVDFYTRQFVDAMAPTNFAMTNPEVLRLTAETGGENLVKGLDNLLSDLERGKGTLSIRMTDLDAFKIGQNIAATPGKVVYQNDLIQLIQYDPTTKDVLARPLMIIPPWINKYYILDLKPKNSFVKWAVDQGHTVFMLSWVNPDESLAAKGFSDYMKEGPLAALDAILKITGEKEINAIGYCLGGTLLATTLAYMAAKKDKRIASATFFTTMVDFEESGELEVFIDEEQIASLEERMNKRGFLEGHEMATTFNMLRANDLIWSFVINNYLMGKEPFPFDLLYWNSDSTRMPAAMHSFYLRNMYQKNKLIEPGGIVIDKVPIDLKKIEQPIYILATREDHIAPWKSAFAGTKAYSGPVRFVLAASGHIAGVVNPPAANKYNHWINAKKAETPDAWLKGAVSHEGSWWTDWHAWLSKLSPKKVKARKPGGGKVKPLEDAPGSYVQVRLM